MFVLCPSCAGPFRIPADQIAPLVQIACPHCEFRMILDIEAANEPSLAEPGQLFAQGFEDAAAYFSVYSHVGPQADVQPRPAAEAPAPIAAPTPTPTPVAATKAPPSTPPSQAPATTAASEAPPARVGAKTIIQAPKRPVSMDPTAEPLQPTAVAAGPGMRAGKAVDTTELPAQESERRPPPHTPPAATAVSNAPAGSEPATAPRPEDIAAQSGSHPPSAAQEAKSKPADEKKPAVTPPETGGSNFIYVFIVVGILIAAAIAIFLNMK